MPLLQDGWQRMKKAWSVFRGKETSETYDYANYGVMTTSSIPRSRPSYYSKKDKTLITTIQNRIANDAAQIKMVQCKVDDDERYSEAVTSGLNNVLNFDANLDQSGYDFKLDVYMSLFQDGVIALIPYKTDKNMYQNNEFDIYEMRVATILEWRPRAIKVSIWDDETGRRQELVIPKSKAAIVTNPFYEIMNAPNSLAQRLMSKYRVLDIIDQRLGSSKLDLIVQLPYPFKGETRMEQARRRQEKIDKQLSDTTYGIAYIDGNEKIIQLNRPIENNLLAQIEYMEKSLYTQLGMTPEILNGTASPETMLNYFNRTVEPPVTVVADELTRKFVRRRDEEGKPVHTDQKIMTFRDPFKLVPVEKIAEIADKFTRNEIATSNEMRAVVGWKPVDDPKADQLRNANLNHPDEGMDAGYEQYPEYYENDGGNQNGNV